MSWKNWLIFRVVSLVGRKERPLNRHFLVVSTTGLGDTLWATPALRALRARYPEAKISVLTSRMGREVLEGCGYADAYYVVSDSLLSFWKPWRELRRQDIDTALIFHTSQRFALPLCALAGVGRIVGTKAMNKGLDQLLSIAIEPQREHEIERRERIVEAVGAKRGSPLLEMRKETGSLEGNIVGIHPGAKDAFKQYPPEYFVEVGRRLRKELGCQVVVTGGPQEQALVDQVTKGIPEAVSLCGEGSISLLAGQLSRMKIFVTNDTGPMHVAFAVGTPTVALFCPTDPALCGPHRAEKVRVLQKEPTCKPCIRKRCHDPFCMRQISIDEVVAAAKELYHG